VYGVPGAGGREEREIESMNRSAPSPIGRCPYCSRKVAESSVLIEYERTSGEIGVFAECPSCGEVVRPE
jgi:uncharacterized protein with PIN domain